MNTVQVNIRLEAEVYRRLMDAADADGTTVTQMVRTAIYRTYPSIVGKG